MLRRPVPWPDGAKVAVAITFDMDADSLVHVAHPRDSITRVSTISMLRYGPEVALPRILDGYRRFGLKQTFFVPAWCDQRGAAIDVVEPLSLAIAKGEFVVFVGPSGCGKTTVMRMIGGLETPSAGAIMLQDREITGPSREKGMVFQSYSSFPWLTVLGNVRFGLKYRRDVPAAEKDRIARHYLELVKLTPFAGFYVNRISGGMRQRVAIARTLAADPLVLLMDEPFGALDALTRERLQLQLLELQKAEKKTVIFVTHDVDEAVFLADRIIVFSARPARVLRDVRVGALLPAERTLDLQETPAFRQLRHEVLALIRDEEERTEAAELAAAS